MDFFSGFYKAPYGRMEVTAGCQWWRQYGCGHNGDIWAVIGPEEYTRRILRLLRWFIWCHIITYNEDGCTVNVIFAFNRCKTWSDINRPGFIQIVQTITLRNCGVCVLWSTGEWLEMTPLIWVMLEAEKRSGNMSLYLNEAVLLTLWHTIRVWYGNIQCSDDNNFKIYILHCLKMRVQKYF